jgi:prepilin-type N-terminal cleavage/methylation domain-containing protein
VNLKTPGCKEEGETMIGRSKRARRGFSLIELVVVVVIIGIIAAIAIPKMSKGAQGAADSALTGDLALIRQAIDMYANEHGGALPSSTNVAAQLTQYTNSDGSKTSTTKDTGTNQIVYGPYLRAIPPLPVGPAAVKGQATIGASTATPAPAWVYDSTAGTVTANTGTATDSTGNQYTNY